MFRKRIPSLEIAIVYIATTIILDLLSARLRVDLILQVFLLVIIISCLIQFLLT
jgi:hypothetical protein